MRVHRRAALPGHETEVLARSPPVDLATVLCVEAWHALGSCRALGYSGMGSIPWTAILTWSQHNQLDRENTDMLIAVIQRLDADRAEREASQRALKGAK